MSEPIIIVVGGEPDDWGIILSFLDAGDPRDVRQQFNAHYIGGWQPFEGFTFDPETNVLSYPGDPPMKPVSGALFRNELILLYPFSWVMVLQKDGSWEVCRMD